MHSQDESDHCDLLVIGGGINGVGVARDAAGRGLRVILCEKDDLASHTSSASSKLIHGGLRYLEYYEFQLVRKALKEREVLMRLAPHLISPLRFIMPHREGLRPRWLLRAGLFLYDHLAARALLPSSHSIDFDSHEVGRPLKKIFKHGFAYSDAWVDDARLVILNAIDAREHGARILTRTKCMDLQRVDGVWTASLVQQGAQKSVNLRVQAKAVVNASGAWAAELQHQYSPSLAPKHLKLVKGSHIVVKRLFEHAHAYIFQHPDGRIVFAIPYEHEYTLIGTTDIEFHADPNQLQISAEEVRYLCELSNQYFETQIDPSDVLWSYSGVRPLVDDGQTDAKAITRDYRFDLDNQGPPILHVFGGKITTYRRLAQDALNQIAPLLNNTSGDWTDSAVLPGGDLFRGTPDNENVINWDRFLAQACQYYAFLPPTLIARYARLYGARIHVMLKGCDSLAALGEEILPGLFEVEVQYLCKVEFATQAQDILWRRTKLGLHLPANANSVLEAWLAHIP
ncbi:glycerol-3-phosphate dehydrogenase [Undibacterium sp. LX40W]|uniref:Glycerol-3-phosphate dehydrogenase n=1 Tax=Undibacterium nitidum TaxID=2762298 RepID=A0A923HZZ3_9BURK|nr:MULTISPECIES: glycerol-3-phosphate dehydrogenase [Undibacterium]MBC3883391.1 glycerol-3-phosphate dehydrogenase [Undibacterium nitidum]MBC3893673.1 glycerol-3-phosphate dehydrogenase [Undibacterium sp. LX40W]